MIQAYLKGKSDIQFNQNEDFKTSSSIGLLQYLPDEVFLRILRDSCIDFKIDITKFGKIQSVNFWARVDAGDNIEQQFVEPDVWIETENYDIILEAKLDDTRGQYKEQWEKEIKSIMDVQAQKKDIVLIALGGNRNMKPREALGCPVFKASWYNLVNAVVKERDNLNNANYQSRILNDVIELLACQGVIKIEWLKTLPLNQVNDQALELWIRHKNGMSIGFATIQKVTINENIIQQWNPIN